MIGGGTRVRGLRSFPRRRANVSYPQRQNYQVSRLHRRAPIDSLTVRVLQPGSALEPLGQPLSPLPDLIPACLLIDTWVIDGQVLTNAVDIYDCGCRSR